MSIQRIDWRAGGDLFRASAVRAIVPGDGKLYAVGDLSEPGGAHTAAVWSSTDGLTWERTTKLDTFSNDWSSAFGAVSDGHGGLIVLVLLEGKPREIWHSPDGATWTAANLGGVEDGPNAIATDGRIAVAVGASWDRSVSFAWSSTDGLNWTRTTLPAGSYPWLLRPCSPAGPAGSKC
jgi:hypothetical protein